MNCSSVLYCTIFPFFPHFGLWIHLAIEISMMAETFLASQICRDKDFSPSTTNVKYKNVSHGKIQNSSSILWEFHSLPMTVPFCSGVFTHMSGPYPKKGKSHSFLRDMCYEEYKLEVTVGTFIAQDTDLLLSPIKTVLTSGMLQSWMWVLLYVPTWKGNIRQIVMYSWYLHFRNYYFKSDLIEYEKCIKKVHFCAPIT